MFAVGPFATAKDVIVSRNYVQVHYSEGKTLASNGGGPKQENKKNRVGVPTLFSIEVASTTRFALLFPPATVRFLLSAHLGDPLFFRL